MEGKTGQFREALQGGLRERKQHKEAAARKPGYHRW
jgi:hypothetical protein